MATKPRNMEQTLELGSRTALNDNSVQSITIYRRVGATPLGRHNLGPAHRASPITTMPNFAPAMRRPSVQPATSPPIKRISSAAVVAKVAPRAAVVPQVAAPTSSAKAASTMGGIGLPIHAPQSCTASMPIQRIQSVSPVPLPTSPRVTLSPSTALQSQPRNVSSIWKKVFLATVPSFFGLMGLSQLYQGRKLMGFSFLVSGAIISFVSSWYIILLGRIDSFLFNGNQLSAYALSFLSSFGGNTSFGNKLTLDLLGLLMVVWGLQMFDALGSVFTSRNAAVANSLQGQGATQNVSIPQGGPMLASPPQGGQTIGTTASPNLRQMAAPLIVQHEQ